MHVCVCVCVHVCMRKREREGGVGDYKGRLSFSTGSNPVFASVLRCAICRPPLFITHAWPVDSPTEVKLAGCCGQSLETKVDSNVAPEFQDIAEIKIGPHPSQWSGRKKGEERAGQAGKENAIGQEHLTEFPTSH